MLRVLVALCVAQSSAGKWEVASIKGAKVHPSTAGDESFSRQYDVTVRVGNTEYVVLYVAPEVGLIDTVRYRLGGDLLVLVGPETIKYNEMTGATREVAILDRRNIPVKTTAKRP